MSVTSAKGLLGGLGQKSSNFCWCSLLYIYASLGWVGQKSPKMCWPNTVMVPRVEDCSTYWLLIHQIAQVQIRNPNLKKIIIIHHILQVSNKPTDSLVKRWAIFGLILFQFWVLIWLLQYLSIEWIKICTFFPTERSPSRKYW